MATTRDHSRPAGGEPVDAPGLPARPDRVRSRLRTRRRARGLRERARPRVARVRQVAGSARYGRLAGPDLIRRVERWAFGTYGELAAFALETGAPYDPQRLVDALRALPADVLQRRLLGAESAQNRSMVSDGAFDRGLAGDQAAIAELRVALGPNRPGPPGRRSTADDAARGRPGGDRRDRGGMGDAGVSRVCRGRAGHHRPRCRGEDGACWTTGSARDALRVATNGVDFDPPALVTDIVIVPTVALRPFLAPVEYRNDRDLPVLGRRRGVRR